MQYRLLRVISDSIKEGYSYCHHYAPSWVSPPQLRTLCNAAEKSVAAQKPGTNTTCACNSVTGSKANTTAWRGVNSSAFMAFIFNFGFGYQFTPALGAQACNPLAAVGRVLPVTVNTQYKFLEGDVLYMARNIPGRVPPVQVSHVAVWTGSRMTFGGYGIFDNTTLVNNLPPAERPAAVAYINARLAARMAVYVIADSYYQGPAYRPFAGWYVQSFSHAARVLLPDTSLPVYNSSIAFYKKPKCMSLLALLS
eukprot:jgi/Chrzof1/14613/Cz09g09140.t1